VAHRRQARIVESTERQWSGGDAGASGQATGVELHGAQALVRIPRFGRAGRQPRDRRLTFNGVWVVDRLPTNPDGGVEPAQRPGQRLITLTTCSELFHTDNRMIAFGHLVSSRPD
jgi:hypothetical protein